MKRWSKMWIGAVTHLGTKRHAIDLSLLLGKDEVVGLLEGLALALRAGWLDTEIEAARLEAEAWPEPLVAHRVPVPPPVQKKPGKVLRLVRPKKGGAS